MTKIGLLGCQSVTEEMNCVMVGCLANLRGRQGRFADYPEDDAAELTGIISCGGCPTGVGADRIWRKVRALVEYGVESLHLTSCLIQLCPFKAQFIETINKQYPDLKVIEGTHPFHEENAFRAGAEELLSQRVVTPQDINDLVFKRIKLASDRED